jgi:hypothetical protein
MSNTYEIVSYHSAHKGQVAALQSYLWTRDASLAARYFEWKYEENPYLKEPLIYLAFQGSELVGMRGFYGAQWELGRPREVWTVLVADDLVISPRHRDRGLVTLIMKAAFEDLANRGYRHVFNLSGGRVTVMGSLAMGWKSAGALEPIDRRTGAAFHRHLRDFLQQKRFFWRYAGSPLFHSTAEREPFGRLDRMARLRGNGSILIAREPRPDAMSELVFRLGHDGRIRHIRNPEFFAWRFRNPLSIYRFLYLGDSQLDGYMVLKCAHPGALEPNTVKVVDLEAAQPVQRTELLEVAIKSGRFAELFAWAATLPVDTEPYLLANGFRPADLESRAHGCPCVLVRPVLPKSVDSDWVLGDRRLTDQANWDMRMLYTMAG